MSKKKKEKVNENQQVIQNNAGEIKVVLTEEEFMQFDRLEKKTSYLLNILGEISYQIIQFEGNRIKLARQLEQANDEMNVFTGKIKAKYNIPEKAKITSMNEKDFTLTATENIMNWANQFKNKKEQEKKEAGQKDQQS